MKSTRGGQVSGWLLAMALAACAPADADDDDWIDDGADGIAVRGSWSAPAAVRAEGDRQWVRYDDAPRWRGASGCGGSLLAGTRRLAEHIKRTWTFVPSYGGYACRPNTANTSQTSVHGTGRAVDVFVPTDRGAADNTRGDAIANWLVTHARELGVQYIVWDRTSWNASRSAGSKFRPYGGPHPHHDHIHVELNVDGAAQRTAWYR